MVAQAVAIKGKLGREVEVLRARKKSHSVDGEAILAEIPGVKTVIECGAGHDIFRQGQAADSVFYVRRGKVKLTVASQRRKEAMVCTLKAGEFFGEGCLAGQRLHIATASAITDCIFDQARIFHQPTW